MRPRLHTVLALVAAAAVLALLPSGAAAVPPTAANQGTLGSQIQSLSGKVGRLRGRIAVLQRRENAARVSLAAEQAREQRVANELIATRSRLARLRSRLAHSERVLARRIVSIYKAGEPGLLAVVLNSDGFAQMVERAQYLRDVSRQDRRVINTVRELKAETRGETVRLASLEKAAFARVTRMQNVRDELAQAKGGLASEAGVLNSRLTKTRRRLAVVTAAVNREAGAGEPTPNAPASFSPPSLVPGGRVVLNPDGSASAPINAPASIKAAVSAGNAIRNKPYIWGGGHGSFNSAGYDCSGSVSYVLHAAGVLGSPLASGGLSSWGSAGPGRWITVYANAGHTFMSVGGLWFDTSGRGANGSRWQAGGKGTGGYAVRHWPGL